MKNKANVLKIFVFGSLNILLLLIAFYSFNKKKWKADSEQFYLLFNDSVNGLEIASPVKLLGVPIGYVEKIKLLPDHNKNSLQTMVVISIEKRSFSDIKNNSIDASLTSIIIGELKKGLCAKLQYQSYLTGRLFIELSYDKSIQINTPISSTTHRTYIPTTTSQLSQISDSLSIFFSKINAGEFSDFIQALSSIARKIDASITAEDIQNIVLDAKFSLNKTKHLLASKSLENLANSITIHADNIDANFQIITKQFCEFLESSSNLINNATSIFDKNGTTKYFLDQMLVDLNKFLITAKNFIDVLEKYPNAIIFGKPSN